MLRGMWLKARAMREQDARWEAEFERWTEPFLAKFGRGAQRRWAPVYLRGLIAPGERKSVDGAKEL